MIDAKIEAALNTQIHQEMAAAYNYYAMAAHFEHQNLKGFATWMSVQRAEELMHAQKLFQYVLDRGGKIELQAIEKPRTDFESIADVFEFALQTERRNTKSINELYTLAKSMDDYATLSHLQWFIDEQVEEEKTFDEALAWIRRAGGDNSALLLLDERLGSRSTAPGGGGK